MFVWILNASTLEIPDEILGLVLREHWRYVGMLVLWDFRMIENAVFINIWTRKSLSQTGCRDCTYLVKFETVGNIPSTVYRDFCEIHKTFIVVSSLGTKHVYPVTLLGPKNCPNNGLLVETLAQERWKLFVRTGKLPRLFYEIVKEYSLLTIQKWVSLLQLHIYALLLDGFKTEMQE